MDDATTATKAEPITKRDPRALLKQVAENRRTPAEYNADRGVRDIQAALADAKAKGHPVVVRTAVSALTADWLLGTNEANRRVSEPKVIQYSDDMEDGRWVENGDGLSLTGKGELNNGQHRLVAVLRSGATIVTNVTVGLTRESRATNDIGLPRTLANVLAMEKVENPSIVGAMTRLIVGWEMSGTAAIRPARENSGPRIQARITSDPRINASAAYTRGVKGHGRGVLSVSQIGFLHYLMSKHSPQNAERFLTGVITGADGGRGLDVTDPRYVARERLARDYKHLGNADRVEIVFRAWNLWRTNRQTLRYTVTGVIPPLVP